MEVWCLPPHSSRIVSDEDLVIVQGDNRRIFGNGGYSVEYYACLLYTSPSPRDQRGSRMPSSA